MSRPSVSILVGGTWHAPRMAQALYHHGLLGFAVTTIPPHRFRRSSQLPLRKVLWNPVPEIVGPRMGALPLSGAWASPLRYAAMVGRHGSRILNVLGPGVANLFSGFALEALRSLPERGTITVLECGSAHGSTRHRLYETEERHIGLGYSRDRIEVLLQRQLEEYELADYIVVPNGFALGSFVEQGIPAKKLVGIDYGVDTEFFRPSSPSRARAGILSVGNLGVRKGTHLLLEAYKLIGDRSLELTLVGTLDDYCRSMVDKMNDAFPIRYLGRRSPSDVGAEYRNAAVFVLTSLQEGQSLAVWEAMASATPIVISAASGFSHLFVENRAGFIVDPHDTALLASRIQDIVRDIPLREECAESGRRIAEAHTWTHYGYQMAGVYSALVALSGRSC